MLTMVALLALQGPVDAVPHARAYARRAEALCPSPARGDADRLLALERAQADVASRRPSTLAWAALGCTRALLELADAIGREGPAMPLGDPWALGAINALIRAIEIDPANHAAAELLALLAISEEVDDINAAVTGAVARAALEREAPDAVVRACSELALRAGDTTRALGCARRGLARGRDSTWHLIRIARVAMARRDTAGGAESFAAAAQHAGDPAARTDVEWHLRWFLSPAEMAAWRQLPQDSAGAFVIDRLAARDVRDGKPRGARLAEHFARLEVVLRDFRLHLPRHVRTRGGFVASSPDQVRSGAGGGAGASEPPPVVASEIAASCEPGTVPAEASRFYVRWQWVIDDRGAVWMRFGPPDRRISARPGCDGTMGDTVRELWVYTIDGETMLVHFEGERYDGAAGATRLVAGVLGSYMCGVDAYRCNMTQRSIMAASSVSRTDGVPVDQLAALRIQDREYAAVATGSDDNSVRGMRNVRVAARLHRVRDPYNDAPLAMVSYAIRVGDLEHGADETSVDVDLALRWWDPAAQRDRDTTIVHRHPVGSDDSTKSLTGFVVIPGSDAITAWSLVASRPGHRGRAMASDEPPLARGAARMSDLVVGSRGSGLVWDLRGEPVPIAPVGRVDRRQGVTVYYQVEIDAAHDNAFTTMSLTALGRARNDGQPDLQVRTPSTLTAGLNEFAPELDVSRLEAGAYRLEVRVEAAGTTIARRVTTITMD